MRGARLAFGGTAMAAMAVLTLVSCASPTEIVIEVYSDACDERSNVAVKVASTLSGLSERGNGTASQLVGTCPISREPQRLGSLVLSPSRERERDEKVAFEIALSTNGSGGAACSTGATGCIVARRRLGYIPRSTVRMRVDLRRACLDVRCGSEETCVQGRCAPADTSCSEACDDSALIPPAPTVDLDAGAADAGGGPEDATVPDAPIIEQVVAGARHSCARSKDGRVWCWGDNGSGQVTGAAPTTTGSVVPSPTLVSPFNGEGFLEIAAGGTSTCGITNVTKTLVCWGLLGDGGGSFRTVTTSNNATPAQLALGRAHGCLVSEGRNAIQCWGDNAFGQLGVNAAKSSAGSVPLGFAGIPLASGAEADFSCANPIDAPLGVTCWGGGAPSTLPQSPVSGLAVGPGRICFWRPDASAECIVSAAGGVVRQFQQTGVRAAAASSANACFATTTPEVVCSGPNVSTVFALDATALAAGAQHYCALGGGGVKCWGANKQKQASPGSETEIAAPAAVVFPR